MTTYSAEREMSANACTRSILGSHYDSVTKHKLTTVHRFRDIITFGAYLPDLEKAFSTNTTFNIIAM